MGTSKQLLDWARAQIGTVGGSKYWQQVYGWSGNGLPWCAVFDSAALKATGTSCAYFPSKVAFDRRDIAEIGSAWVDRYSLQAGDMVSFDWGADGGGDHVGIIEEVLGGGAYQTIEGNVSDSVGRRTRYVANIIGGIRPRYSGEAPKPSKLYVDGVFGVRTVSALQLALQSHGYYVGYLVDGKWGYYSKLSTQRYLRAKGWYTSAWLLDGWFGSASVKALQGYLRSLGYTDSVVDGYWGELTTKALQKALNAGRF